MSAYKTITTVCPYCGAGCVIDCTVDTENNCIIEAKGSPDGVNNEGRLCLKGLYGWDYLNDPQILKALLSSRYRGTKPSNSPPNGSRPSSNPTDPIRSWVPAQPAARETKRPISCRNSCAPSSARTTSTTAPAFDTLHLLPGSVSP